MWPVASRISYRSTGERGAEERDRRTAKWNEVKIFYILNPETKEMKMKLIIYCRWCFPLPARLLLHGSLFTESRLVLIFIFFLISILKIDFKNGKEWKKSQQGKRRSNEPLERRSNTRLYVYTTIQKLIFRDVRAVRIVGHWSSETNGKRKTHINSSSMTKELEIEKKSKSSSRELLKVIKTDWKFIHSSLSLSLISSCSATIPIKSAVY